MAVILTQFSEKQFKDIITEAVVIGNEQLLEKIETGEQYLKMNELCSMLQISPQTAISWGHKKILKPIKICNKVFYRQTDIDKMMDDAGK